jgi:hypothetical protein
MKKKKIKNKNVKFNKENFLTKFIDIINSHKNNLPKFNKCKLYKQKSINTNSWFDINKTINNTKRIPVILSTDKLDKCEYKQIKVKMILSDIHKKIFQTWFKTSITISTKFKKTKSF